MKQYLWLWVTSIFKSKSIYCISLSFQFVKRHWLSKVSNTTIVSWLFGSISEEETSCLLFQLILLWKIKQWKDQNYWYALRVCRGSTQLSFFFLILLTFYFFTMAVLLFKAISISIKHYKPTVNFSIVALQDCVSFCCVAKWISVFIF